MQKVISAAQLEVIFDRIARTFPMNDEERAAWVEHCVLAELRGNIMQGLEHLDYHWFQRFTDGTTVWGAKAEIIKETTWRTPTGSSGTSITPVRPTAAPDASSLRRDATQSPGARRVIGLHVQFAGMPRTRSEEDAG